MYDEIEKLMQIKPMVLISLIGSLAFVWFGIINFKSNLKKNPWTILGFLGVILPGLVLLVTPWHGFSNIALNSFAIFTILNFLGLLYIIKMMRPFMKSAKRKSP